MLRFRDWALFRSSPLIWESGGFYAVADALVSHLHKTSYKNEALRVVCDLCVQIRAIDNHIYPEVICLVSEFMYWTQLIRCVAS